MPRADATAVSVLVLVGFYAVRRAREAFLCRWKLREHYLIRHQGTALTVCPLCGEGLNGNHDAYACLVKAGLIEAVADQKQRYAACERLLTSARVLLKHSACEGSP